MGWRGCKLGALSGTALWLPGEIGMQSEKAQEIRALCESWRSAALQEDGRITLGEGTERFRLTKNDVRFHELDYAELTVALTELTKNLLLPRLTTLIDLDQQLFWAWCAEILLARESAFQRETDPEITVLATVAFQAALANMLSPGQSWNPAMLPLQQIAPNAYWLLIRSQWVLTYLSFPLLEAVGRRVAMEFVDYAGRVRTEFQGRSRRYTVGQRCNNVGDLLFLIEDRVANENVKRDLTEVKSHLGQLMDGRDGYEVIYDWRNSSLHGETSLGTIGGTVLMVAIRLALETVAENYEDLKRSAIEKMRGEIWMAQQTGRWQPPPWPFYPPFLG